MNPDSIHISIMHLNAISNSNLERFQSYVKNPIHCSLRLKQSLASYYCLNNLTIQFKNRSLANLGFTKTNLGKPFFKNDQSLYCSISHSESFIAAGLGTINFGLDIEQIEEDAVADLEIAFSKDEWQRIKNNANTVYKSISYKESIGKLLGTGFTIEPSSIHIDKKQYFFYDRTIALNKQNYIFTLASEKKKNVGLSFYHDGIAL